jgi:hypothetical protein
MIACNYEGCYKNKQKTFHSIASKEKKIKRCQLMAIKILINTKNDIKGIKKSYR